jgi:hypothetical protein
LHKVHNALRSDVTVHDQAEGEYLRQLFPGGPSDLMRDGIGRGFSFGIGKLLFGCALKSDRLVVQGQFFRRFASRGPVDSNGPR